MAFSESVSSDIDELSINTCDFLLDFLIKVKNLISPSLPDQKLSTNDKAISLHKLWKCYDKINMLNKIMKYAKLILHFLLLKIRDDESDPVKLNQWRNTFDDLMKCIVVFSSSRNDYGCHIGVMVKYLVEALLEEIRQVDMKDYPEKIFMFNSLEYMISEFLRQKNFTNITLDAIVQSFDDITKTILTYTSDDSHQIIYGVEGLNRCLNIIQKGILMDLQELKKIDVKTRVEFTSLLKKAVEIEFAPKIFRKRVKGLVEIFILN
ncbi:hypothetical protein HHI36_019295 [Cryptolaemus montrouzieri]|uniref:Uncharacterized protein n=1 Tax=Cryptolaemus montrouzieri TaxID=559131 RepID=A0ABD2P3A7_9CUCU